MKKKTAKKNVKNTAKKKPMKKTAEKKTVKKAAAKKAAKKKTVKKAAAKKKPAAKKAAKKTVAKKKPTPKKTAAKKAEPKNKATAKAKQPKTFAPPPPVKGRPSPPPPTKGVHAPPPPRPGQGAFGGGRGRNRGAAHTGPGKPPRPTMPWPTGTSTAGLRVADGGVLPPRQSPPPPPPPVRKIKDLRSLGKISTTTALVAGIRVTLDNGRQLLLPYTVVGPEDISRITTGEDGESIILHLRNGETLDYSLVRIQALAETIEERKGAAE